LSTFYVNDTFGIKNNNNELQQPKVVVLCNNDKKKMMFDKTWSRNLSPLSNASRYKE
jgi:hypothetical protein